MRLRAAIPAGLLDAAFASLATFSIGLAAVTQLTPAALGAYSLFFTAFLLATVAPSQLVFLPAEIVALAAPERARGAVVRRSLRFGLGFCVIGAMAVPLTIVLVPKSIPADVVVPLAWGSFAAACLSPIQDHIRRVLHLSGASWSAASMSILQFIAATTLLVAMFALAVPTPWIPFTTLTLANAVSLTLGVVLLGRPPRIEQLVPRLGVLLRSGRWLLIVGAAPAAAGVFVAAAVANLAGPEALGHAEAARILAQPVLVLSMGLGAVIQPRSMESGAQRDRKTGDWYARAFAGVLGAGSVAYLLVAAVPWPGSPLIRLFVNAYTVSGLVALTVGANFLNGLVLPYRAELLGGMRETSVATWESAGAGLQCVAALIAPWLHAYTKPAAFLVQGTVRAFGFWRARGHLYADAERAEVSG